MSHRHEGDAPTRRLHLTSPRALTLGALLLIVPCWAEVSAAEAATSSEVQVSDQARARFEAGVLLLRDPDGARYEEAYEEFKAAYADSPSWKILGNLALCAMKLERDGEAIAALERSVEEGRGQLDSDEHAQQEQDLKLLKDRAATLTLRSAPNAAVLDERITVSGSTIKNRYRVPTSGELVLLMRPGNHRITAELSTGPRVLEVTLSSGGKAELHLEAESAPVSEVPVPTVDTSPNESEQGPSKVPAFIGLGVGAAGVILGGVFLGLHLDSNGQANQAYSDCEASRNCTNDDVSRIEQLDSDAAMQGTVSLLSFGVGAIGIGTGLTLLLLQNEKEAPPTVGLSIRPYASAHTFGLRGHF